MNPNLKKTQVYLHLREKIRQGYLAPGEKLAGESVLASELGVSRVTLRETFALLAADNLIERVPRKGTFVTHNLDSGVYLLLSSRYENDLALPVSYIRPGIEKAIHDAGHHLEFLSLPFVRSLDRGSATAIFNKKHIRGIFLLAGWFRGNEKELQILRDSGLPVVATHCLPDDREFFDYPILYSDMPGAFAEGLEHLADSGYKRVLTLSLAGEQNKPWNCRGYNCQEYLQLLESKGLACEQELLRQAPYDYASIKRIIDEVFASQAPPEAIMCFSDFIAIHVYQALKERKLRIPDDVAVMGFCGYPGGRFFEPPLSTIDLEYEQIGKMAAEVMLNQETWQKGCANPLTMRTPHQLVQRQSTARKKA